MMSLSKKKQNITTLSIIIGISIAAIVYKYYIGTTSYVYSLGTIVEFYKPAKGGKRVKFSYNFKGKEYEGTSNYSDYNIEEGEIYIIKIYIENPYLADILLDKPVNSNIKPPKEGWQEIPKIE